jgi:hypothetical protein
LAQQADALLQAARALAAPPLPASSADSSWLATGITASLATDIYQSLIERWHIRRRFPQPDWSPLSEGSSGRKNKDGRPRRL